ncbi:hypothetical protein BBta_p0212 (plasmid) [Bradyrhizobium sp. BTAi1]|nr:hypothetical protein BBta_p0212 [Bradyrhizobium sp. BTAi1]
MQSQTASAAIGPLQSEQRDGLDCVNCHSNRDSYRELYGRDCAACHRTASWQIAGYVHPSVTSKDCVQCHQARPSHYMEHFVMMDRMITDLETAEVNQCTLPPTDSFNKHWLAEASLPVRGSANRHSGIADSLAVGGEARRTTRHELLRPRHARLPASLG